MVRSTPCGARKADEHSDGCVTGSCWCVPVARARRVARAHDGTPVLAVERGVVGGNHGVENERFAGPRGSNNDRALGAREESVVRRLLRRVHG